MQIEREMFESFEVRGYFPPGDLKRYAAEKLSWLLKVVPNNSRISFRLERQGIGYRLDLDVETEAEVFSDQALANDAETAIDRMNARFSDRLAGWIGARRELLLQSLFAHRETLARTAAS